MGPQADLPALDELIICPQCDALYRLRAVEKGDVASCTRCHTVLAAPRRKAGMLIISLAVATLILIIAAVFFPFLTLQVQGFRSSASLLDIALSWDLLKPQGILIFDDYGYYGTIEKSKRYVGDDQERLFW